MSTSETPSHPYAAYSVAEWKRQPTTSEVLFGLELPYRAPKSAVGAYLWRWRLWFEVTFALSMLQPWEKILIVSIANTILISLTIGIYLYLPQHLAFVYGRAMYYLLGPDAVDVGVSESLQRIITGWSWNDSSAIAVVGAVKEL